MAEFVPAVFRCRRHELDLTEQVAAEALAAPRRTASSGWGPRRMRATREAFSVVVHCPGEGGEDEGHDLTFRGSVQP
jgi:hypothetical protein